MSKPRYQLIANELRAQIASGEYAPGDRLPTKPELMQRFGVALATLNQGLQVLRDEGLVETFQGVGTFVQERPAERVSIEAEIAELKDRIARLETQMMDVYSNLAIPDPTEDGRVEEAG
ncbi:GntR family transcriptional regulator [Nocardia sp. NPDC051570]|uniref:GntR family transcriptional regulator n=1 Tax=Nocardia sp. NPDC051570 TaxID=3364324 RepID=UPI0037AEE9AF